VVEVVIAGDFNRHDQLWGGDNVSLVRQGEADLIIDLMNEFALSSLLRRGSKIFGSRAGEKSSPPKKPPRRTLPHRLKDKSGTC
jgi:hypothetical protein